MNNYFTSNHEDIEKIPDPKFAELLMGEDTFLIADFVCYFSNHLTEDEEENLEQKSKEELLAIIEDRLYNHVEEWIEDRKSTRLNSSHRL